MSSIDLNSAQKNLTSLKVNKSKARFSVIALFIRSLFFMIFGLAMVFIFSFLTDDPWNEVVKWWPFQVIFTNIVTFFILAFITKKEGTTFISLINIKKDRLRKDIKYSFLVLVVSFLVGAVGLYTSAYLIFRSTPPEIMFQPLPLWAAIISVLLLPFSNSIMETTTYMGYSLARIEGFTGNRKFALSVSALALAFQHIAFPLVFDLNFMIWRLVSFIPLAFVIGLFYIKRRNLVSIIIAHFFMDLQLVVTILFASL